MTAYDEGMDYDYDYYDEYDDASYADPEQEDAANSHGLGDLYVDKPCLVCGVVVYTDGDSLHRNAVNGDLHTCVKSESISMEDVLGKPKESTMKNTIKVISVPTRGISASALSVGQYARVVGQIGTINLGDIILKTAQGVVNISDPSVQYGSFSSPFVELLKTGDKLEITVGFTSEFEESIRSQAKGNKIMAIKAVREATSWGLKEAKEYVDSLPL